MDLAADGGPFDAVLVTPNLGDGGTQRVVCVLAAEWQARGKRVCVVTLYPGEDVYPLPPGVPRIAIATDEMPWFVRWSLLLVRWPRLLGTALRRARAWIRARIPSMPPVSRGIVALVAILRRFRDLLRSALPEGLRLPGPRELWNRLAAALPAAVTRWLPAEWAWRLHLPTLLRVRALRRTLRSLKPHSIVAFCGSTNLITVLACRRTSSRLVISERNDPVRQTLDAPWQELRPKLYSRADVVTANSQGSLEALRAYVPEQRLRFAPNPLWVTRDEPLAIELPAARRFLIVGRLHRQKAHDVLFDAFARVAAELPAWVVTVVGMGEEEAALRSRAASLGLEGRVEWIGQVTDPYPYYRKADVLVLPSRHEGFPNALLEAMSVGVPAIVSDGSPGPLEIVRPGENGWVVPVEDVDALSRTLLEAATNDDVRARFGAAAKHSVEPYQPHVVLSHWESIVGWRGA